jgi:hypothetical protein
MIPVTFSLAGAWDRRHAVGSQIGKLDLDISHMATPDEQRTTELRGHQNHVCKQDAVPDRQRA